MKYFVITSTIKDGEYEYLQQTPVMQTSEKEAIAVVERDNNAWIEDDYREQEINSCQKITKAEWLIIHKYIY